MVREMEVVLVKVPEVPLMVTVTVPVVAVLLAVSVKVLVLAVVLGLNDALTPLGRPEAERLTLLLKPLRGVTVMMLEPAVPCVRVKLLGEAESVKFATGAALTVRETVVVLVKLPEVPLIVMLNVPVVAVLLAVRVKLLAEVAGLGVDDAVTPLGRPEADRLTLPLKPFCGVT